MRCRLVLAASRAARRLLCVPLQVLVLGEMAPCIEDLLEREALRLGLSMCVHARHVGMHM